MLRKLLDAGGKVLSFQPLPLMIAGGLSAALVLGLVVTIKSFGDSQYQRGVGYGQVSMTIQQLKDADAIRIAAEKKQKVVEAERDALKIKLVEKDVEMDAKVRAALLKLKTENPDVEKCLALGWPSGVRKHLPYGMSNP